MFIFYRNIHVELRGVIENGAVSLKPGAWVVDLAGDMYTVTSAINCILL